MTIGTKAHPQGKKDKEHPRGKIEPTKLMGGKVKNRLHGTAHALGVHQGPGEKKCDDHHGDADDKPVHSLVPG